MVNHALASGIRDALKVRTSVHIRDVDSPSRILGLSHTAGQTRGTFLNISQLHPPNRLAIPSSNNTFPLSAVFAVPYTCV